MYFSRGSGLPSNSPPLTLNHSGSMLVPRGGHTTHMHGSGGGVKPASALPLSSVYLHIQPLKSFKSFMQTQAEDLPPEAFQRKYDGMSCVGLFFCCL